MHHTDAGNEGRADKAVGSDEAAVDDGDGAGEVRGGVITPKCGALEVNHPRRIVMHDVGHVWEDDFLCDTCERHVSFTNVLRQSKANASHHV
jgi:hypothetical protein